MPLYRIIYNGYAANKALYREQEITVEIRHDWDRNTDEAAKVMLVVHKKLKEHFSQYDILLVEKIR